MKLYLVIFIHGLVAGSVGPTPLTLANCEAYAAQRMAACDDSKASADTDFTCADITLKCEYHAKHPEIEYRLDGEDNG